MILFKETLIWALKILLPLIESSIRHEIICTKYVIHDIKKISTLAI